MTFSVFKTSTFVYLFPFSSIKSLYQLKRLHKNGTARMMMQRIWFTLRRYGFNDFGTFVVLLKPFNKHRYFPVSYSGGYRVKTGGMSLNFWRLKRKWSWLIYSPFAWSI